MAITFTLVSRGSNHIVYLATSEGSTLGFDAGTIQSSGVGDADVSLRDAAIPPAGANYNAGLLKQIVDVEYPIGPSLAGAARRQLMDWGLGGPPGGFSTITTVPGKRARAFVQPLAPGAGEVLKSWTIDAVLDGVPPEHGEYLVNATQVGVARALVIIEAIGTPQQF